MQDSLFFNLSLSTVASRTLEYCGFAAQSDDVAVRGHVVADDGATGHAVEIEATAQAVSIITESPRATLGYVQYGLKPGLYCAYREPKRGRFPNRWYHVTQHHGPMDHEHTIGVEPSRVADRSLVRVPPRW